MFVQIPTTLKRFYLILLLLFTAKTSFGQQLVFNSIRERFTFPSKECYGIMQDSKGYIWIGTELGLCRLNGNEVKVFDRGNGLPEAAIYAIAENKNHTIWMLSSNNRILNYAGGRLKAHPLSTQYQSALNKLEVSYAIHLDSKGNTYLNSSKETFFIDKKNGRLEKIPIQGSDSLVMRLSEGKLIPISNGANMASNYTNVRIISTNKEVKFRIQNNKKIRALLYRVATASADGNAYFSFNGKLIKLCPDLSYTIHEIGAPIISLYADQQAGLWIGTIKGGVHYYPGGKLYQKPIISLSPYSVSGILEDAEHNIWCNTLEKGTFISRSKQLISYANLEKFSKPVYFTNSNPPIVFSRKIENGRYISYGPEQRRNSADTKLLGISPQLIISQSTGLNLLTPRSAKAHTSRATNFGILSYERSISPSGIQYYISYSSIFQVRKGMAREILRLPSPGKNLLAISDDNLLYATAEGLFHDYIPSGKTKKIKGIPSLITRIAKLSNGKIWIATKGWGLFEISANGAINISGTLHLPTNVLYDIVEDKFKQIWISSNHGLIRLNPKPNGYHITTYTTIHGLPANEVYKLTIDRDKLLFSTSEGLASLPLGTDLSNHTPPAIYLNAIRTNQQFIPSQSPVRHFPFDQNSLKFSFDVPAFKDSQTSLRYSLNGKQQPPIKGNSISLDNLAPGSYSLKVYGVNSDGIKSRRPEVISFTIANPFYQKAWFIIAYLLLAAAVIVFSLKAIINRIKKRESEKTRVSQLIADSKLTALQAQMNPHFVFNAINSIQNYIISKKEMEAYDYLAKFGRLIRMVLHNSQQKTVSLLDELETISLYVSLEQLRFDDSFDMKITVHPDIDQYQTQVPTLLIQPHLENAIWHGLMNLAGERRGGLEIEIQKIDDRLSIMIADNGVGRERAMAYRRSNQHQPVALEISRQRLDSYNQMFGTASFLQEIKDKYDNNGNPLGTIVVLTLPSNLEP